MCLALDDSVLSCRGPVWKCADQVQIKFATARALAAVVLSLIPILSIICPYYSATSSYRPNRQLHVDYDQAAPRCSAVYFSGCPIISRLFSGRPAFWMML